MISELHKRLVRAVSPPAETILRDFELDKYKPHLSLGLAEYGMSRTDLGRMQSEAEIYLSSLPPFEVEFVRVYCDYDQGKYVPIEDISLPYFSDA